METRNTNEYDMNSRLTIIAWSLCASILAFGVDAAAQPSECGNGTREGSEGCDDGNLDNNDGCSSGCLVESGNVCVETSFELDVAESFSGGSYPAPNWVLSSDKLSVTETVNSAPSVYSSTLPASLVEITFSVEVQTRGDNDFVGFVIGYQAGENGSSDADFLLLDWKQAGQNNGLGRAEEGLSLNRVLGAATDDELWSHDDPVFELARGANYGDEGWDDDTVYEVKVDFQTDRIIVSVREPDASGAAGNFREEINFAPTASSPGGAVLPDGNFGFYTFSQPDVRFELLEPVNLSLCRATVCGDDVVEGDEACDLGAATNGTSCACAADCTIPTSNTSCEAGDFCTSGDTCDGAGSCEEGSETPCNGGEPFCDEANDVCVECQAAGDCNDGNACNGTELCLVGGVCEPGFSVVCGTNEICEDPAGDCVCAPGFVDDGSGTCVAAQCTVASDCDDANVCTDDSCSGGLCSNDAQVGRSCEAGDFCRSDDVCNVAGVCEEGTASPCSGNAPFCDEAADQCIECRTAIDCGETGNECSEFTCDVGNNTCVEQDRTDGVSCTDDGSFCSGAEICQAGTCGSAGDPCSGPTPFCDEGDDVCVECESSSDCDDGNACNGSELCVVGGVCELGTSITCGTNEVCEDPAGDCVCAPGFVDDGSGSCVPADCVDNVDCNDSNVCTADVCTAGLCSYAPTNLGGDCDNGDFCDGAGTCDAAGACVEPGNPCGPDAPVCIEDSDSCDVDTDGDNVPDSSDLDDDDDGVLDADEGGDTADEDGDGIPNRIDLDADGDGIPDNIEAQPTDGYRPPLGADSDGDGIDNAYDLDNGGTPISIVNTDETDGPDFLDTDSDNDGLDDVDESGQPALSGADVDQDGLDDAVDSMSGFGPVNGLISDPTDPVQLADTVPGGDADYRDDLDTDGDTVPDSVDIDDDGDGIVDTDEGETDNDSDGIPNLRDLDADGDGIPDNVEAQTTNDFITPVGRDTDGDGLDDTYDADDGGAAIDPINTDGTGSPDYLDLDSDGDGTPDVDESGLPALSGDDDDNDGLDDAVDGNPTQFGPVNGIISDPAISLTDTDGDVAAGGDVDYRDADGAIDTDGDGIPDSIDADDDDDGIPDTEEGDESADEDGDNIPNRMDLDADGDGIPDNIEAQSTDGYVAPSNEDTDGDGLDDAYDADSGGTALSPVNTDDDAKPDFLDTDSDDDGLDDDTESGQGLLSGVDADDDGLDDAVDADNSSFGPINGQITNPRADLADTVTGGDVDFREDDAGDVDTDGDTIPDSEDVDDDNDGIRDEDEGGDTTDTDGDGIPNRLDLDADGDGIPDNVEAQTTDGYTPPSGVDSDGDGLDDAYVNIDPVDTDDDGEPDFLDTDSDGDGTDDVDESGQPALSGDDTDNDGLDDAVDGDPNSFGPVNGIVTDPRADLSDTTLGGDVDFRTDDSGEPGGFSEPIFTGGSALDCSSTSVGRIPFAGMLLLFGALIVARRRHSE